MVINDQGCPQARHVPISFVFVYIFRVSFWDLSWREVCIEWPKNSTFRMWLDRVHRSVIGTCHGVRQIQVLECYLLFSDKFVFDTCSTHADMTWKFMVGEAQVKRSHRRSTGKWEDIMKTDLKRHFLWDVLMDDLFVSDKSWVALLCEQCN